MKTVSIKVPENRVKLVEELLAWEPQKMKKNFSDLIYFFAVMGVRDQITTEVAFNPDELHEFLQNMKYLSEAV